jgi:hypothetical protein
MQLVWLCISVTSVSDCVLLIWNACVTLDDVFSSFHSLMMFLTACLSESLTQRLIVSQVPQNLNASCNQWCDRVLRLCIQFGLCMRGIGISVVGLRCRSGRIAIHVIVLATPSG